MNDWKKRTDELILSRPERYIGWGHELQRIPEVGFREKRTSSFIESHLREMGVTDIENAVGTGRIARLHGRGPGPVVCFLAEMDAVHCPGHPLADPETGMAHVCGHHIQSTALLAIADAITSSGVMEQVDGTVMLVACPAEELLTDADYAHVRETMGVQNPSGKQELLRLGLLDGVDAVLSTHALVNDEQTPDAVAFNTSCNGYHIWKFDFMGRAAHSAVCPENGANALNAAVLAINSLQALRETFPESDHIRMSYKLSDGGVSLSTVPEHTMLEVQVRASNMKALNSLMKRVETAVKCAAGALDVEVQSEWLNGYLPYEASEELIELARTEVRALTGNEVSSQSHGMFSTDLGDVSQRIPTLQIVFGGFTGDLHSTAFKVVDETLAYVTPARVLTSMILDLLGKEK